MSAPDYALRFSEKTSCTGAGVHRCVRAGHAQSGGEGGIRTHGTLARTTVFETAPIDHSGTSPGAAGYNTGREGRKRSAGASDGLIPLTSPGQNYSHP